MPVAKGGPPPLRQAALVGLGALMTLGTILFLVLSTDRLLGGRPSIGIDRGEAVFRPGPADELAGFIADNDNPVALRDPSGGDRDIWLNHIGGEVDEGWYAFGVRPLSAPRDCVTEWRGAERHFVDSCDGTLYPPDGQGLPQYPVTIDGEGELAIRLDLIPADAGDDDTANTTGDDTGSATTEGD
jgi:hypothetical protein